MKSPPTYRRAWRDAKKLRTPLPAKHRPSPAIALRCS
jgi:hypothetical protein